MNLQEKLALIEEVLDVLRGPVLLQNDKNTLCHTVAFHELHGSQRSIFHLLLRILHLKSGIHDHLRNVSLVLNETVGIKIKR